MKFTAYEAESIQGLVANSPLLSWGYSVLSVQGFAMLIGVVEIVLGLLIATRPVAPKLSAIGTAGPRRFQSASWRPTPPPRAQV